MKLWIVGLGLLIAASGTSFAQSLDADAKGKKILLHVTQKLTGEQIRRLNGFKNRASFYAALGVNLDDLSDDAFGASWGAHSLKAAQDMALRSCTFKSGTTGRCILLTSNVPGNRPAAQEGWGMSHDLTEYYRSIYKHLSRKKKGHFALASNDYFAWGWSGEASTREATESLAMKYCRKNAGKTGKTQSAAWRAAVVDPQLNTCSIRLHVDAAAS